MKNLPRSILISMPIVVIVYVLMNISYLSAMSAQELFESDAVGVVRRMSVEKKLTSSHKSVSYGQKLFSGLGVGLFLCLCSYRLLEVSMLLFLLQADR